MPRRPTYIVALLLLATVAVAGEFVPNDTTISDSSVDLRDPEFDPVGNRMVWQDGDGNLWIADVDPVTGDIAPTTGMGQMLDTDLASLVGTGNGPEWGYGQGEVIIAYTKRLSGKRFLGLARQDPAGQWIAGTLANNGDPGDRWRPLSTDPGTVDTARLAYIRAFDDSGERAVAWRNAIDASTERTIFGAGTNGGQWAQGERAFVSPSKVDGVFQLFWVDIDTEEVTQITDGPLETLNALPWLAPEYDDQLISAAMGTTQVGIFRRIDGVWTLINTIRPPTTRPFIGSPEPFVHNGKSYVTMIASQEIGVGPLAFFPTGPSEVWIAGIDPDAPFYRRVDDGSDGPFRTEPEAYTTTNGPVIYYTLRDNETGNALLNRADTGLGPPAIFDEDNDGLADSADNCRLIQNPDQRDTDADGIGNLCDADLDQDCTVAFGDVALLRQSFGQIGDLDADFDGNGIVNFADVGILASQFFEDFTVTQPSGAPNLCDGA